MNQWFRRAVSGREYSPEFRLRCFPASDTESDDAGYTMAYTPASVTGLPAKGCSNAGVQSYTLTANPIDLGCTGNRYCYLDNTGVLRANAGFPAAASSVLYDSATGAIATWDKVLVWDFLKAETNDSRPLVPMDRPDLVPNVEIISEPPPEYYKAARGAMGGKPIAKSCVILNTEIGKIE